MFEKLIHSIIDNFDSYTVVDSKEYITFSTFHSSETIINRINIDVYLLDIYRDNPINNLTLYYLQVPNPIITLKENMAYVDRINCTRYNALYYRNVIKNYPCILNSLYRESFIKCSLG